MFLARQSVLVLLNVSLVVASVNGCSAAPESTDADDEAATGTAASALSSKCTLQGGGGMGGPGVCSAQSVYQCGADTREIVCDCPTAQCSCMLNGVVTATVAMTQCPSCTPTRAEVRACGIR